MGSRQSGGGSFNSLLVITSSSKIFMSDDVASYARDTATNMKTSAISLRVAVRL